MMKIKNNQIIFRIKVRVKFILKNIKKNLKIYFKLPHIWILIIILVLAFLSLLISFNEKDESIASIYSNIFAGLLTGVIISLVSIIKSISLYRAQCLIEWLSLLHKDCLEFIKAGKKIYSSKDADFSSKNEKYEKIYDLLCLGNNISVHISQERFNVSLPFNSYKFCKKAFNFDAIKIQEVNEELREKIIILDIENLNNKEIRELFKEMDHTIFNLNSDVLKQIELLKIKVKAINIT